MERLLSAYVSTENKSTTSSVSLEITQKLRPLFPNNSNFLEPIVKKARPLGNLGEPYPALKT